MTDTTQRPPTTKSTTILAVSCLVALGGAACAPSSDEAIAAFPRGTTWQITLSAPPTARSHDVTAWDLDLADTPAATIAQLKRDGTPGVICYFSAGTWEPWRDDADAFPDVVKGNAYDESAFDDERYVDVRDPVVLDLMRARLDRARDKGCVAVDPDNVDLDRHDTGFAIDADDMRAFNERLVDEAHARGLAVGLKNALEHLPDLGDRYDFFVNESCVEFDECDAYADVLAANKAVFNIEYTGAIDDVCSVSRALGLSTLRKELALDDTMTACP